MTAIRRFGSELRLNLYFHVVALDGVYVRGADGRLSFRRVIPHTVDIERLVLEIAARCAAWLERQGLRADEEVHPDEDDSLSLLQQASVGGTVAVGARARRAMRSRRAIVAGSIRASENRPPASPTGRPPPSEIALREPESGGDGRRHRRSTRPRRTIVAGSIRASENRPPAGAARLPRPRRRGYGRTKPRPSSCRRPVS